MLFNGEVAIVSGAAQGIGKAIAEEFSKEGAKAVILDINDEKGQAAAEAIKAAGGTAMYVHCNVASVVEIEKAVETVTKEYGRIDILVNDAGILHSTPVEDITEEEWDRIMAINLKGAFFLCQKVLPSFKKLGCGRIVNMASLAGRMGGIANGLGYTASKAALIGITYGLATRLAKYNVTVNAVAPGTTETDILKAFTAEKIQSLRDSVPLKRLGLPQDIANAVVFLSSSKASWITGAILDVNGGMFVG
jgi:NAD(P)-dependent dehydrogenase (short-subunit alcohol dehydrogenase family)